MAPQPYNAKKLSQSPIWRFRFLSRGNTLAEYGLIGALVLLSSIGVLLVLGGNLNDVFGLSKNGMDSKIQAAHAAGSTSLNVNSVAASTSDPMLNNEPVITAGSNGESMGNSIIVTAGSNGDSMSSVNSIQAAAQAAFASGNLTQEQFDTLKGMANKGHEIAELEGLIRNARLYANGNAELYQSTRFPYQGGSYTVGELVSKLEPKEAEMGNYRYTAEVQGIFSDPAIGSIVDTASNNIMNNGGAEVSIGGNIADAVEIGAYQNTKEGAAEAAAKPDSHVESGRVCNAGGYDDNGVKCNPG